MEQDEDADQPTGCVGLKLDFPLNKITGYMKVCFSLGACTRSVR